MGGYRIKRLFCYDCNKWSRVIDNKPVCARCGSKNCAVSSVWETDEEKVLLKYHFYDDDEVHISDGYYDAYDFQFHIANNPKFRIVCVIAWKELPKESE